MQTKEITYGGKRLVYRSRGHGPLVVLLHGFGEDGRIWKNQFDLFPEHQLIVPDLPGSGQSEAIDNMSMEGLAGAVKAIIEEALPAQAQGSPAGSLQGKAGNGVILIGHSMGGYVTLAFAESYPGLLRGFGLFHSSAFADSEEKKATRQKGIRFAKQYGAFEFLKTVTPGLYAPQSQQEHPEWIEEHLQQVRNFSTASLVSYYEAMLQRPNRTAVLAQSRVPVLFVAGEHDSVVPPSASLKQCHLPPVASFHILAQSGHMGMIEEKDAANHLLTAFVNFAKTMTTA